MPHILFVDDDPTILVALQQMLEELHGVWDLSYANSAEEALALMRRTRVNIIVSDLRMPRVDGTALLTEVGERWPSVARFIAAAPCEMQQIYRSASPAHQFLTKPFDAPTLVGAIKQALALRSLLSSDDLVQLVSRIHRLPSMAARYQQVLAVLSMPEASLREAGGLVEQDLGMSAKVLQLVNSAFFGVRQTIASPSLAVSLLGLDVVRSLFVMDSSVEQLGVHSGLVPGFSHARLQRHSMSVAMCARALATLLRLDKPAVDDAFMAGLFHDIGKLVLVANLPATYAEALEIHQKRGIPLQEAEYTVLKATHAEVGAYLLGLWAFADRIVEVCAYHHTPHLYQGANPEVLLAVHAADAIVKNTDPDGSGGPNWDGVDMEFLQALGVAEALDSWYGSWLEMSQRRVE
jgi:putative nucleotidyltransferase with HDIG domain